MRENYEPGPMNWIRREPDTYAMKRMRDALRPGQARLGGNAAWGAMPIGQRVHLCSVALGPSGVLSSAKQWDDLDHRERMLIGAAARAEAGALL